MKSKPRKTNKRVAHVTGGSGNIFADLGLPNPEQELLKAQLTLKIYTILNDSGMTQVEIAKILGVRNRVGNFSVGRLMEFLFASRHGNHRVAHQQGTWRPLSGLRVTH